MPVPPAVQALCGSIGSSIANVTLYPLDVAIVRAQVERDDAVAAGKKVEYESVKELIVRILKQEGLCSLFGGAVDDLVATAVQSFLYFFVYNKLRDRRFKQLIKSKGSAPRMLSIQAELIYGALAGIICKIFTTPLKNIVLLKQLGRQHSNLAQCIREIYRKKGIKGFWAGYKATLFLSVNPSLSYYFFQLLGSGHRQSPAKVFVRAATAKSMALMLTYPVILAKTRGQASDATEKGICSEMWNTLRTNGVSGLYDGAEGQLIKGIFSQGITMSMKESIERVLMRLLVHSNK